MSFERQYKDQLKRVLREKNLVTSRNGKIRQASGITIEADLQRGFPLITSRKAWFKNVPTEAAWMLKGKTNVKYLNDRGVTIWDQWADSDGNLGPVYGHQLRSFNGVDQIKNLEEGLKNNRYSRRHLVNMWNPSALDDMALPPCHFAFEVVVSKEFVDIVVFMRSLDMVIGLPYDIAVYALYLDTIANFLNTTARKVVIMAGNAHIYEEHSTNAAVYIGKPEHPLPSLINENKTLSNFNPDLVQLKGYKSESKLTFKLKV